VKVLGMMISSSAIKEMKQRVTMKRKLGFAVTKE